jgi:hypothetical protein
MYTSAGDTLSRPLPPFDASKTIVTESNCVAKTGSRVTWAYKALEIRAIKNVNRDFMCRIGDVLSMGLDVVLPL